MNTPAKHTDTAPARGGTADTGPDTPLLVAEMVAQQMRTTTTAIYRYITYISLWVLLLCSATFAAVQVWALRNYLPDELPSPAAWALPIALQVLVLAAELILLSSAVTRSWAVQATAGAVMAIGYGAEITAHLHEGERDLLTTTFVVMSALLALCWTLLALALRAGITDADAIVTRARAPHTPQPAPAPEPEFAPAAEPEFAPAATEPAPVKAAPEAEPTYAPEPDPVLWEMPQTADTAPDQGDTPADTDADTAVPEPGSPLSDIEMDAVVHMIATETDPPRSYREMETRYRELGYVGAAGRLRESWHRVTQPVS
ncbi:hypothetical protein ABZ691_33065 [Streptomyces sp. NPDC006854]|uniref:hypothetical protein n=1 Tax=Streptomyces sp. NPDC006854 TaxID=3155115 RepID=UPI0033CDC5ED